MIWSEVDGVWCVNKRFKGCDWSEIVWTYEHKTQCLVCAENGINLA